MSKSQAPTDLEALRRRCHELVDKLNDPDLINRAKRFLTYLYIYKEPDIEKDRPALPTPDGQDGEKVTTQSIHPHFRVGEGVCQA